MSAIKNLRVSNNETFQWSPDLSFWAALYTMSAVTVRMQIRSAPTDPDPPVFEWLSTNTSGGRVVFDPASGRCAFLAPETISRLWRGRYSYDVRLELLSGGSSVIFSGWLEVADGVTRSPGDASGAEVYGPCDTVTVDGSTATLSAMPSTLISLIGGSAPPVTTGTGLILDLSIPGNFWLF